LRVIGANLVAFNDVTKKATATIGLKKAIAVEDDQPDVLTPASGATARSNRYVDEYDGLGGVERSFRLIFPNDEEIMFFADTDEEKAKWSVIQSQIERRSTADKYPKVGGSACTRRPHPTQPTLGRTHLAKTRRAQETSCCLSVFSSDSAGTKCPR
jgi:hypothetical protein